MADVYTVERTRHIDAPPEVVRERIVDFHRWPEWSPWEDVDPDLHRTYGGADSGAGAWYEWEGNRKAGKGRMEIVDTDERTVHIDLRFSRPFTSQTDQVFDLQPDGEGTLVTWTMTGPNKGMTRLMGVFTSMDKMIGPDFEKGLTRLKAASETAAP